MAFFQSRTTRMPAGLSNSGSGFSPEALLLETYIVDTVAPLSAEQRERAAKIAARLFPAALSSPASTALPGGVAGAAAADEWRARLRQAWGFADDVDSQIRTNWETQRALAARHGIPLSPRDFAQMLMQVELAAQPSAGGTAPPPAGTR